MIVSGTMAYTGGLGIMSTKRKFPLLSKAPISEALLDIRVTLPSSIGLDDMGTFHDSVKDRFPIKKDRVSFQGGFQLEDGKPTAIPVSGGTDGYLFESPTEQKVVQARLDGFTFNKLKPYENWKKFSSEARELWDAYVRVAHPEKITRIALRYINRIEIPLPVKDFKEYIHTTPEVARELPQGLAHFFMRLVIPYAAEGATVVVTETMENVTDSGRLPIILDIDASKEIDYVPDSKVIWKDFEKLRELKNQVFFESITQKTKELLNGARSRRTKAR
jgi:uncharacterized protein (TIGR04255 family)